MWIKVTRIHPDGSRTVIKPRHQTQGDQPLYTAAWPPCSCPRCRGTATTTRPQQDNDRRGCPDPR